MPPLIAAPVPLAPSVEAQLSTLGSADIVVGIPSFNNAHTIAHVVRAVLTGLSKYFPDHRAVCVNADGGSRDGTPDIVAQVALPERAPVLIQHAIPDIQRVLTPYHGLPGKGSAFRTVFEIARRLGARACAVVDSDLRSIRPEWVELLVGPVLLREFDYVAPLYLRHKYDGTITNSIVYPMTRALYGLDVRQPIGGEFGFSGRLAEHYLRKPVWESDVARFGIDVWMTTTAIADGFNVCQSFLGAKIHDAKDPGSDLVSMFTQVVSSVFDLMVTHADRWPRIHTVSDVPLFGFPHGVGLEPVSVNVDRMLAIFKSATRDLREIWQEVLRPQTINRLVRTSEATDSEWHFSDELWVDVVYECAVAYRRRSLPPTQLLQSLVPLYLGRTASFVMQAGSDSAEGVEARIAKLAAVYLTKKPYLASQWPSPEEV